MRGINLSFSRSIKFKLKNFTWNSMFNNNVISESSLFIEFFAQEKKEN